MQMLRVLVVDGYDDSREALSSELRRAGYDVVAVAEEDEAILVLSNTKRKTPIDVVILDLPLSEALEAAHAVRAVGERRTGKDVTIVAVVAPTETRSTREAAHLEGVDYFVLRPCPPSAIVTQLRRLFPS